MSSPSGTNDMSIDKYIKSLRIPFEEIRSATNNFADENLLTESSATSSSKVYKGQLLQSGQMINIVARTCYQESLFFNELVMSKNLRHKNIVSIFKVAENYEDNDEDDSDYDDDDDEDDSDYDDDDDDSDDDGEDKDDSDDDGEDKDDDDDGDGEDKDDDDDDDDDDGEDGDGDGDDDECYVSYIITKQEANESLDKHLSGSTLTWIQRLHICVGVAQALTYIHYHAEDNHSIIHGNIRSSKILLDENWEPKLHGFGFAIRAKRNRLHVTSRYNGSLQYMDPLYETTRGLTHKSDVFSFGVVLYEVLFGREATVPIPDDQDKWYFARLAKKHYEEKTLDDMIDPDLRKQMNLESFNIFSETAYCCLKEQRSQRPNMNQVLKKLKKALEVQHQHEHSTVAGVEETIEGIPSHHWKGRNLDHLKFQLSDIELATNNFSDTYRIGSGGYATVYKAKLEHFDGINSLAVEGKYKGDFPKRLNTVAIKRIISRLDGQGEQGFLAEIELLSKCKHPNIVSLLGFCDEGPEMILVYEYSSNGSLDDYLENDDNMINLSWAQRIQIGIDIAHGLSYLHTNTEDRQTIIHRDIKSANILLGDKLVAKIADFGLSRLHHALQQGSTLVTDHIAGTEVYLDPEYKSTGKLKTKSDIYSFGVVLFEIMCGKLAYNKVYGEKGLPSIARQCFKDGTLKKLVDPQMKELDENMLTLNGGVNQDSLNTFSKIAYQCLAETQSERPGMEVVIIELEKALNFQKNSNDNLHMSLQTIKMGTQNFSDDNCIGEGRFWKLYEGKVSHATNANGCTFILAKRWDSKSGEGHDQFWNELEVLLTYKHDNIIGLFAYCNELDEKIIVYEHASNGSLNSHLDDPSLTWMKRLKICINVASGLLFLHTYSEGQEDTMIHGDIKSGCILLDSQWSAKISNLELSHKTKEAGTTEHVTDNDYGSFGYVDPQCHIDGYLTKDSDIYSVGVILLEILCGRLAWGEGCEDQSQSLGPLAKRHYDNEGSLDELVFPGIKEQIAPKSLATFQRIAILCVSDVADRPYQKNIVTRLNKALELQEDHDIWESKLPSNYTEIINMSKTPEKYSSMKRKDLNDLFVKGILLQDGKRWLSLSNNGEWNETISAKTFSYGNRGSYKWRRSIQKSRFKTAVKMLDISNLNIQIRIKTRYLSPNVIYGAYLVFKFYDPRKYSSQPTYVNLKYKIGGKSLHAYFATWRDKEWMMIELSRFLNYKKDTEFEVLLESVSRSYCGVGAIYVEGVEFRVIDNVKGDEIETIKEVQVQIADLNLGEAKLLPICKMVTELLKQQVHVIKCKIENQTLSPDTDYMCSLVFKLSEKCHGLHCPVRVRDVLRWRNKEARIIYFKCPSPSNLTDNSQVPKEIREDGSMEVIVWKFNSTSDLRNGCIPIHLKLIAYEGTLSGLILQGLEIQKM